MINFPCCLTPYFQCEQHDQINNELAVSVISVLHKNVYGTNAMDRILPTMIHIIETF